MRAVLVSIALPLLAAAQVSVKIIASTSTQAVLEIRGASGTCTGTLTDSKSDTPHPYVNNVDFSTLENYVVGQDETRLVTLGRETGEDALRESTDYSVAVACGDAAVEEVRFRTPTPYFGPQPARSVPFDPARFGNRGWPRIDWTRAGKNKTYTDPLTGVQFAIAIGSGNWGIMHPRSGGTAFARFASGPGWANPERVGSGGTNSYGSISGSTEPVDLFVDMTQWPWNGASARLGWGVDNLGLLVWGKGSESAEADRQVKVGFHDGTDYLMYQIVTLPEGATGAGTVAKVNSADSDDNDSPWPAAFRDGGFTGWTINRMFARNMMPIRGLEGITQRKIEVSGGSNLRLNNDGIGYAHHLPVTLKAGNKIWLGGSSCPNELCTITSVTNHNLAMIAETIADGTYSSGYTAYPFSIRVEKVTANGTIEVGLRSKAQATLYSTVTAAPGAMTCGPWKVRDATGRTGGECWIGGVGGALYFISDDLTVFRQVSMFYRDLPGQLSGWKEADKIAGGAPTPLEIVYPDSTTPHTWYVVHATSGGKRSLFKMVYTGDYSTEWAPGHVLTMFGSPQHAEVVAKAPTDQVHWTNLTKPSEGRDLATQVAAFTPNDPEWIQANWNNAGADLAAVSGSKGVVKIHSGGAVQDAGTCLIAIIDLPTGNVQKVFGTGKGLEGFPAAMRWGACHALGGGAFANTFRVSQNDLGLKGSGGLFGGPFEVTPVAVKMPSGFWSTDTAMKWPTGHGDNAYDKTCPSDIPDWLKDYGATGNSCVTFKLPHHPCFTKPSALAREQQPPCPSDPAWTMPQELKVGDRVRNKALTHGELLRLVKITPLAGGELETVWARNAVWDYCCRNDDPETPRSSYCLANVSQMSWASGFTMYINSGHTNACRDTTTSFVVADDGSITYTGESSTSSGGHTAAGAWLGNEVLFVGFGSSRVLNSLADLDTKYPTNGNIILQRFPRFAGHTAQIGSGFVQAYFNRSHTAAEPEDLRWTLDANHLNDPGGGTHIGARKLDYIGGDVWKVQVVGGAVDYKRQPLLGWAGVHVLKDVSPADIASAPDYSFCHVYRTGDCGTGDPGETFVKVPRVYPSPNCDTALMWGNSPCIFSGEAVTGWGRRFDGSENDVDGRFTQNLTMGLAGPGLHPSFWGVKAGATGKFFAAAVGNWVDGLRPVTVIGKMPDWKPAVARNDFGGLTVQVGQSDGMTHARVRFGYTSSFRCTERLEACLTDENLAPFAFETESLTAKECTSGCSIDVPAIPGRLLYYQLETYNGFEWVRGNTTAAVAE